MTRKTKTVSTLDELIPSYGENKERLDTLKGICDEENKEIKRLLGENKKYEAGGWKVSKSIQNRDSVDEDLLCAKLSNFPEMYELGVIKVKEYVDMSALEDAIYKKQVTQPMIEAIEKCRQHREVVTLRISRVNGGE